MASAAATGGDGAVTLSTFEAGHASALIRLWNDTFRAHRNFCSLTPALLAQRITGSGFFDPQLLVVAHSGAELVGFAHGGVWDADSVTAFFPQLNESTLAYLAMIAVDERHRRLGIGRRMLAELRQRLLARSDQNTRLVADGRMYNPFYGNFLAPIAPLWGTTEGAAIPQHDEGTRAFFNSAGFGEVAQAWSLVVRPASARLAQPSVAPEMVSAEDYQPHLGSSDGVSFPLPNASRSWVAVEGDTQCGTIIIFPLNSLGAEAAEEKAERWAIYTLEVSPQVQGRGWGRALLGRALEWLEGEGCSALETVLLPLESVAALDLYNRAGFVKEDAWIVVE